MPLTSLQVHASITFQLQKSNPGFQPTKQGPERVSFAINADVDRWSQAYAEDILLAPNTGVSIDLTDLINFIGEDFAFTQVLSLFIEVATGTHAEIQVGPEETTDGWSPYGPGETVTFFNGEATLKKYCNGSERGREVTSTARNLMIANVGTGETTVTIAISGRTTDGTD